MSAGIKKTRRAHREEYRLQQDEEQEQQQQQLQEEEQQQQEREQEQNRQATKRRMRAAACGSSLSSPHKSSPPSSFWSWSRLIALSLALVALGLPSALSLSFSDDDGHPKVVLTSPRDGEDAEAGAIIKTSWQVLNYDMAAAGAAGRSGGGGGESDGEGGGMQVLVLIEGKIVHSSRWQQDSMEISSEPRLLSIMVFLCSYNEIDGITQVLSTDRVEFRVVMGKDSKVDADSEQQVEDGEGSVQEDDARSSRGKYMYESAKVRDQTLEPRGPVVIMAFHCNRPSFLALQAKALKKFIMDDYILVVIDDAQDEEMQSEFRRVSAEVGAEYVVASPDWIDHSQPSKAVGKVVTWAVEEIAVKQYPNSIVFLLEGDMFPVAPFSPSTFLKGYDIAGTPQQRVHDETGFMLRYLWVGILLLDMANLPNKHLLNMEQIEYKGVVGDTSSGLHHFLDASPEVKVRPVLHTSHINRLNDNLECLPREARERYRHYYRVEMYERAFLHYGSASNWKIGLGFEYFNSPIDFLPEKTRFVEWFVNSCINGSMTIPDYDYYFNFQVWDDLPSRQKAGQ